MPDLPGVFLNVEAINDDCNEADIDLITETWATTAAYAFYMVEERGRGVVTMTVTEEDDDTVNVQAEYVVGAPCPCFTEWVESYCPMREVLMAVVRDNAVRMYRLTGTPAPAEAYLEGNAEWFGECVH